MKEEAKKRIEELTDRFQRNIDVCKNGAYNETRVRLEFIDPFFEALGWDVANKASFPLSKSTHLNPLFNKEEKPIGRGVSKERAGGVI